MLRVAGGGRPLFLAMVLRYAAGEGKGNAKETKAMWYFSWILGIGVALGFGIINAMWLDANSKLTSESKSGQRDGAPAGEASTRRA
jgi:cytochrome bd-I ubiquinol oxidase subunit X